MQGIIIRRARKSDLPSIQKLLAELVDAMEDTECIDVRLALKRCEDLLNDASSYFLVAQTNRTVVGFVHFTIRQTLLHGSPSALIDELVVRKEYRGKGIGRQLVLSTIEQCRKAGCCEVEVSTERRNIKARKFYQKCGFDKTELLFELDL